MFTTSTSLRSVSFVFALCFASCGPSSSGGAGSDRPVSGEVSALRMGDGGTPEALSRLGEPLLRPATLPNQAQLEMNLADAEAELAAHPESADALIWVGRRLGYLWRYNEAIERFGQGVERFPADPRFLRHRGHRYLTVRDFPAATADLERAAMLIEGQPDEVEPDGAPNAFNQPRSSLHFNIWYHLALSYFLQGDFERAARAWQACLEVSTNDDSIVAASDWLWISLMRLDREAEAAAVLAPIEPDMDILENGSYHRRLLMYKGELQPEAVLGTSGDDELTVATQGFGVGNYLRERGDTAQAQQLFSQVVDGAYWAAFGYIAAEVELARDR